MLSSYIILGLAILCVLGLKYYLINKSYENKLGYYIEPHQLSLDVIEKTVKTEGKETLRTKFSYENLLDVISTNLVFLRLQSNRKDIVMQKLRNICLCIQIINNKEVVELTQEKTLERVKELVKKEDKYLEKLRSEAEKPTLQEAGVNRYVSYLEKFASGK